MIKNKIRVGDLLIKKGVITQEELLQALNNKKSTKKKVLIKN